MVMVHWWKIKERNLLNYPKSTIELGYRSKRMVNIFNPQSNLWHLKLLIRYNLLVWSTRNVFILCTMLQKLSKCEVKAWFCWSLIILPSLRFYVKSNFGKFKRQKIQSSESLKLAKIIFLNFLNPLKLDFT